MSSGVAKYSFAGPARSSSSSSSASVRSGISSLTLNSTEVHPSSASSRAALACSDHNNSHHSHGDNNEVHRSYHVDEDYDNCDNNNTLQEGTVFLSFAAGDHIVDITLLEGGWWYGTRLSKEGEKAEEGYFPSAYVELNHRQRRSSLRSSDGGALRRSMSRNYSKQLSAKSVDSRSSSGAPLAPAERRSSISLLRKMAYDITPPPGVSSALEESALFSNSKSGRKSSIAPLDYVNERIVEQDENESQSNGTSVNDEKKSDTVEGAVNSEDEKPSTCFRLKDDATGCYFTFKNGIYSWEQTGDQ